MLLTNMIEITSHSEHETRDIGRRIGERLTEGTVVGLSGTLGTGKTRLTQGIGLGLGIPTETITSPTYTLCVPHLTGQKSQPSRRCEEGRHRATHGGAVGNRVSANAGGRRSLFLRGRVFFAFLAPLRPRGNYDAGPSAGRTRRPGTKNKKLTVPSNTLTCHRWNDLPTKHSREGRTWHRCQEC